MTATLSVLVGIDITDSNMSSNSTAEPGTGEVAWSAATTYAVDDVVVRTTTHRRYSCLTAGVDAGLPEDTPLRWYDLGPTNRWAMLDGETSTQTVAASPHTVVLEPGHFNAAYWDALVASQIHVVVKDEPGGTEIFNETYSLEGSAPPDYYEHFYDPFRQLKDLLIDGIEPYVAAEITATLSDSSGTVKCGVMRVGDLKPLGTTLSGAKAKPKSYSRITVDDEGNNKITRGKRAKDMSASAILEKSEAAAVTQVLTDLLDIPCLWSCTTTTSGSWLRQYGLGSGEVTDIPGDQKASLSLNVNGLI